jgi:phosphoglycolate phosphatase-like HAD superfamily hydrolase
VVCASVVKKHCMKLVIFDIDGTLTQTSAIDEACFRAAYAELLELLDISTELETCPHISDTGITRHIYQSRLARAPHDHEEAALCARVVDLLHEHQQRDVAHFAEVSGAVMMLERLAEKHEWAIAVATGCWRASAELKLRAANIRLHEKPAGFAEDGPSRETIVSAAIERAQQHYNRTSFDKIVSVGDGVWDVKTAANLGLSFIGIAEGARAETLHQHGAKHVLPNYADKHTFFTYLEEALIPHQSPQKSV